MNENKLNNLRAMGGNNKNKVTFLTPPSKPSTKTPYLLVTTTKEPLLPTRLYYSVNPRRMMGYLSNMQCASRADGFHHFAYQHELASLDLGLHIEQTTTEHPPCIIGRCKVNYQKQEMLLDVDSYQRAIAMVEFLSQRIPETALSLKFVATYNRFAYTSQNYSYVRLMDYSNYDHLFSEGFMQLIPNCYGLTETKAKQLLLTEYPLIKRFAVQTDFGITDLKSALEFNIAVAKAISEDINCSIWDFYHQLT